MPMIRTREAGDLHALLLGGQVELYSLFPVSWAPRTILPYLNHLIWGSGLCEGES